MEQSELAVQSLYETHARSCDPRDFQNQVMRAPHGKPMAPDQVAIIVDAILRGLDIGPHDLLLDLCCGNGVITDSIFARCRGGVGVDFTPYLIEVAKANFEQAPDRCYVLSDARAYVESADDVERYTKAMCYGSFQCLLESKATAVLIALRRRFPGMRRVLLGNLPDLDRADIFWRKNFGSEPWPLDQLRRHDTPFGIWRTEEEITRLAAACGWHARITRLPPSHFSSHFRFDAVLTAV